MPTVTSRTFRTADGEAVSLPPEVAFGAEVEVTVVRSGDVLTIYPRKMSVAEMFERLAELPAPAYVEEWDVEELPEPPGL